MLLVGEKGNREKYGGHKTTWGGQRSGKVEEWHHGNGGTEAYTPQVYLLTDGIGDRVHVP